jgi:two-component system, OmpR family, copper resistance phosphate regulon response regulator CusR
VRILASTSDADFAAFLERTFRAEHFIVEQASEWSQAQEKLESRAFDLALLDLSAFEGPGVSMLQQLRGLCPLLPILVLINSRQMEDSVGLTAEGADDFAQRDSISNSELVARARAVMQRGTHRTASLLRVQDLELDSAKRAVLRGGKRIHLTSKEYSLLEYLMRNAGSDVTREQIIERAWNLPSAPQTNVVEVYINYLRKKIDGDFDRKLIRTVRGTGYRLLRADGSDGSPVKAASA